MIQVSGAGSESMVFDGENTWGFGFNGSDEDDNSDWFNLSMWGDGNLVYYLPLTIF